MGNLLALALATMVLVAIPGPNVALIVANSLRYGFAAGASSVAGTTAGVALQLLLLAAGVSVLIEYAAAGLLVVKWLGVAYLVILGIRTWRRPPADLKSVTPRRVLFGQGLLVAVANPKTLLFHAAFLPQFLPANAGVAAVLSAVTVMLAVLFAGDLCWALGASRAGPWLARSSAWRNRVTGALLVGAGLALAAARR